MSSYRPFVFVCDVSFRVSSSTWATWLNHRHHVGVPLQTNQDETRHWHLLKHNTHRIITGVFL